MSSAVVHRFHPDFGAAALNVRSYLNCLRPLFVPGNGAAKMERLQGNIDSAKTRNHRQISAWQIFCREKIASQADGETNRPLSQNTDWSSEYHALGAAKRARLDLLAADARSKAKDYKLGVISNSSKHIDALTEEREQRRNEDERRKA